MRDCCNRTNAIAIGVKRIEKAGFIGPHIWLDFPQCTCCHEERELHRALTTPKPDCIARAIVAPASATNNLAGILKGVRPGESAATGACFSIGRSSDFLLLSQHCKSVTIIALG